MKFTRKFDLMSIGSKDLIDAYLYRTILTQSVSGQSIMTVDPTTSAPTTSALLL